MPLPLEPRRIVRSAFFNESVRVIVTAPVDHAVLQVALESQDVRSVFIW